MITNSLMESYLGKMRLHLAPLTLSEREEIVMEIAAHVRDSAEQSGASVEAVLTRLGPAEALAAQYRDGQLISQASRSFSPPVLLRGALRLATKGAFGVLVFVLGVFGYLTGGSLVLSALLKPIFPANTGLWVIKFGRTVSTGALSSPPAAPAHEILGLWYILLALTVGSLTLLLTTWAIRKSLHVSSRMQSWL